MSFTLFAFFSYIIDSVFLLIMRRRSGEQVPSRARVIAGRICVLSMVLLYCTWSKISSINTAAVRYLLRLFITQAYFLLCFQLKPSVALYTGALLTEITNLVHGFFLTPLTSTLQWHLSDYLCAQSIGSVLMLISMLILRAAAYYIVYKTVSPANISDISLLRVLLVGGVTVIALYTRSIQFTLLNSSAAMGTDVSIYFCALQLALLAALILYENYQYRAQESRALKNQQIMTASLLRTLELRNESDETIRCLRHDLKNHMFAIKNMILDGLDNEAVSYINEFLERSNPYELRIQTGRSILDALLNEKLGSAVNEGIAVSVVMDFRAGSFIKDFDLCMLMGNALDNALEACRAMADDTTRFIEVKGGVSANMLTVRITNSCGKTSGVLRTSKKNPQEHGYGLNIMRNTAELYNGMLSVMSSEPGRFCLVCSIPLP